MPRVGKMGIGVPCLECGHMFRNAHDLARHAPQHDPDLKEQMKTPCPYPGCDFSALQKSNLDDHINIHTGTKPHKCREPACVFRCANRSSLTRHHQECHEQKPKRQKAKKSSRTRVLAEDSGEKEATKVRKKSPDTDAVQDHRVEAEKVEPDDDNRASSSRSFYQPSPRYTPYTVPGHYDERLLSTSTSMPMHRAPVAPHLPLPVDVNPAYTSQFERRTDMGLRTAIDSERVTRQTPDTADSAVAYAPTPQSYLFDPRTPDYPSSLGSPSILDEGDFSSASSPLSVASYPDDDDEIGDSVEFLDLDAHSEWQEQEEPMRPPPPTSNPDLPLRYPPFSVKPHLSNLLNPE